MTPEPEDRVRLQKSEVELNLGQSPLLDAPDVVFLRESPPEQPLFPAAIPDTPVRNDLSTESALDPDAKERLVVQPTERKRQHLINIIANPNTKESEWLKACEILRDWNPLWSSRKTFRKNVATILLAGATICAGLFAVWLMPQPMFSVSTPSDRFEQKGSIKGQDFPLYLAYLGQMKEKIQGAWSPPSREVNGVGVHFTVSKDGRVDGITITRSLGSTSADAAVLDAVKKASPFDRLPNSTEASAEINLTLGVKPVR